EARTLMSNLDADRVALAKRSDSYIIQLDRSLIVLLARGALNSRIAVHVDRMAEMIVGFNDQAAARTDRTAIVSLNAHRALTSLCINRATDNFSMPPVAGARRSGKGMRIVNSVRRGKRL